MVFQKTPPAGVCFTPSWCTFDTKTAWSINACAAVFPAANSIVQGLTLFYKHYNLRKSAFITDIRK